VRRLSIRVIGGILLIAAGVLYLLQNLNFIESGLGVFWTLLFVAGGALFLYIFFGDRAANWWSLIPGITLLGLAAMMLVSTLTPEAGGDWGVVISIAGLALSFWAVYLVQREHWWSVIPGGVMLTLAVVIGLSSILGDIETAGVFFLGLGLTFALLAFLPSPEGRMKWALIPAAALLITGLVLLVATADALRYLWPVALILIGGYVIFRVLTFRGE
jgi:hypothetical protein